MAKSIVIKPETLVDLIKGTKGATFITFKAETKVKLNKSNPYFDRVTKQSEVNAQLNFNYENAVNNRRANEGKERDFQTKGLKWGGKAHNNSVVENNGKLYLQVRVLKSLESIYQVDGKNISKDEATKIIPERKSYAAGQGVESEVIVRTYGIASIKEVTMNGIKYLIQS